jgi:hypothetical protein
MYISPVQNKRALGCFVCLSVFWSNRTVLPRLPDTVETQIYYPPPRIPRSKFARTFTRTALMGWPPGTLPLFVHPRMHNLELME